jgi:hypothetical protein
VRRETNLTGTEASQCSYTVEKDATRVVGLGVGAFASADEAANAYARARADAQFDGLKIENAYFTPPSKAKARDAIKRAIDRNRRRPG